MCFPFVLFTAVLIWLIIRISVFIIPPSFEITMLNVLLRTPIPYLHISNNDIPARFNAFSYQNFLSKWTNFILTTLTTQLVAGSRRIDHDDAAHSYFGVILSCSCFSAIYSSPSSHSKAKKHDIYCDYASHASGCLYRTWIHFVISSTFSKLRKNRDRWLWNEDAPAAIGPYNQAIKVGDLLFVSGCIALDPKTAQVIPGGIAEQAEQSLKNMKAIVEAGGSELGKVVKALVRALREPSSLSVWIFLTRSIR